MNTDVKQYVLMLLVLWTVTGCGGQKTSDRVTDTPSLAMNLQAINSDTQLVEKLTNQYRLSPSQSNGQCLHCPSFLRTDELMEAIDLGVVMDDTAAESALESSPGSTADNTSNTSDPMLPSFSNTNTVVSGVDEADYLKFDGRYFYLASDQQSDGIQIFDTELTMVGNVDMSDDPFKKVMVADQQLVTIDDGAPSFGIWEPILEPVIDVLIEPAIGIFEGGEDALSTNDWATVTTWDLQEPTQPVLEHRLLIEGYLKHSRRIDDELFLISEFYPRLPGVIVGPSTNEQLTQNLIALNALKSDQVLPRVQLDDRIQPLVSADQCFYVDLPDNDVSHNAVTTITRYHLQTQQYQSRCIIGPLDGIYLSKQHLYLYNNTYYELIDLHTGEDGASSGSADDNQSIVEPGYSNNRLFTHLHRFAIDDSLAYQGSIQVPGSLGWDGDFRIGALADQSLILITTDNEFVDPVHQLHVLRYEDDRLQRIATLPNSIDPTPIGKPGEKIYSARIVANRAYIVTFQQTDPLYVIDLSEPQQPRKLGELEIPGFSDYLHPVSDDLLLGIGHEVRQDERGIAYNQGVKVALFDVSGEQSPRQLMSYEFGQRGSRSAVSSNYLAFAGLQRSSNEFRFTLPIRIHRTDLGNATQFSASEYHPWEQSGLLGLSVHTQANGVATIENEATLEYEGAFITDHRDSLNYPKYDGRRRGILVGDQLYQLGHDQLYRTSWSDLSTELQPQ